MRKKNNYPANLLNALRLNDLLGTDIDYENLTEDQIKGADYILALLTEREEIVLDHYYNFLRVKSLCAREDEKR